jgi:predicted ATPase/DNA-binding winged helix-turn-helix (wHTH) protein
VADLTFAFGPFRLLLAQRIVLRDSRPLRLGGRAFDLLALLVQRAGQVISNEELMAEVWSNVHVDERSLRVHVTALRKALDDGVGGARYITNTPGRGYSFVASVSREQTASPSPRRAADAGASNLPVPLARIIGRGEIIASLAAQLRVRRFLTILGPGGVGKTTVAVAVAESLSAAYDDGIRFVDFSSLSDPALVPLTVSAAIGETVGTPDATASLVAGLRDKRVLIVLDNCEHVVQAVAPLAVALLQAAPGVAILSTSREALRAEGEWVQRLPSLAVPPVSVGLAIADALAFPAVQLFNDRAKARTHGFTLSDEDVPVAVDICRELDGIPLAIELAAARVDVYGVKGLATLIKDHLLLAARGHRTAQPRHQTLRAMLDWSYDLLPESEAAVLRRLAVFTGEFSLEAAMALAGGTAGRALTDHLASLVRKSLVAADLAGEETRYRLLATTRLYALEKLRAAGEDVEPVRHHGQADGSS